MIVIVDPESSSRVALPVRAASASRATSAALAHRSRASACRTTGTISPASVCVAMPMFTASKRVTMPCSSSNRAFICGNAGTASTIARIRNGRMVSRPRVAPNRSLSVRTQDLELGDVDFLDVGEVRNAQRRLHVQRDLPSQPDHRDRVFAIALGIALHDGTVSRRDPPRGARRRRAGFVRPARSRGPGRAPRPARARGDAPTATRAASRSARRAT